MFDTVEIHNPNVKKQIDNVYNPRVVNPAEYMLTVRPFKESRIIGISINPNEKPTIDIT